MSRRIWKKGEEMVAQYDVRTTSREKVLMTATMNFVVYFMMQGDDQAAAEGKVSQISTEIAALLYVYTLGNKQPLLDAINDSTLPFMDVDAKAKLIGDLTPTL